MERVHSHLRVPTDSQHQPVVFATSPAPLSDQVDEIVEYMRFIGERRAHARS